MPTITSDHVRCMATERFVCDYCGSGAFARDRVIVVTAPHNHNAALCPDCAASVTWRCGCGTYVYSEDAIPIGGRDDMCCPECSDMYCTACSGCGCVTYNDDLHERGSNLYCEECHLEYNFPPGLFRRGANDSYTKIRSRRRYGIELETASCTGYAELDDHAAWGAKDDCTVMGKELYSAILSGDRGLEAIRELAAIATANSWTVDHSAGFHLHLDMRSESVDGLWAIALAYRLTEGVWFSFVESDRHDGEYSHEITWNCTDLASVKQSMGFSDYACHTERHDWANLSAYRVHRTIEIRLHHGTVDAEDVINWVKAHTRFVDWASKLGYEGVKEAFANLTDDELFTFIAQEIWDDNDLTLYYSKRAQMYQHGFLTESIGS